MLGLAYLLLVGLVVFVALTTWAVIDRLRKPPRRTYASAVARSDPGDPSELVPARAFRAFSFSAPATRRTPAATLPAWEIQGDLSHDPAAPIVIATPGWGDSKVGVLTRLGALAPLASRVIAWDPSGMGEAPGKCNLGTEADVLALVALVDAASASTSPARADAAQHGESPAVARAPVILFGWSMGAGISIAAARLLAQRNEPPLAVIAEAPYRLAATPVVNYLRLIRMPHRATRPLAMLYLGYRLRGTSDWSTFDRARLARDLASPLLVLHGTADTICPVDDGRAIAAAAPSALVVTIEGAGHNNLWTDDRFATQCARGIADFVAATLIQTRR